MLGIASLQGLIAISFLFYGIKTLKRIELDNFRDNLFEIRATLFDLPTKYELSYNSKVYRHYERILNNNIRFAHKLTFFQLFIFIVMALRSGTITKEEIDSQKKINREVTDEKLKKEFEEIDIKLMGQIVLYLKKTSLCFFIIDLILTFFIKRNKMAKRKEASMYKAVNILASNNVCDTVYC